MTLAEREERIMRAEECVRAHGDREALALFRIMRETGIRMNELLDLVPENMNGRELLVVESKYKEKGWYRNADGSCPVISEELMIACTFACSTTVAVAAPTPAPEPPVAVTARI